jgi:hypothetical protein
VTRSSGSSPSRMLRPRLRLRKVAPVGPEPVVEVLDGPGVSGAACLVGRAPELEELDVRAPEMDGER